SRESKSVALREIDCPPDCPQKAAKQCSQSLSLQYLIPKVGGIGVYQTDTRSWNSIRNVRDGVHLIKSLTGGRIALLPLTLSLVPMDVQPEIGPKHRVYVLQLTFAGTLQDLYRVAELPPARAMLPDPDEDAQEESDVEDAAQVVVFDDPSTGSGQAVEQTEEQRRISAWRSVQQAISAGVTKAQVVRWLKEEAGFAVGHQLVSGDLPPEGVPTDVIERLRDALGQAQMRLG
ncbi:MAG: hypothetical protein L0177_09755, partial [Chloroflexi bacterium]|nr:hypothetical protein [Chloroflexota bacterium]